MMTTRGAKEKEMYRIGRLLGQTLKNRDAPEKLNEIAAEVRTIAESHPVFSGEWVQAACRE